MNRNWPLIILCLSLLQFCEKPRIIGPLENEYLGRQAVQKEYGFYTGSENQRKVTLDIGDYPTFRVLHSRAEKLACNDSIPQIVYNSGDHFKKISLNAICWEKFACVLIPERNIIQVTKDSVFKTADVLPIEDLFAIMDKDYHNYGKDPMYSESPDRIGINIIYESMETTEGLLNLLDQITANFDALNLNVPLNISLCEKLAIIAPPPPPRSLY